MMKNFFAALATFFCFAVPTIGFGASVPLEKIRFPYATIGWQSLPFWLAKEAKLYEKHGLEVDMLFEAAGPLLVQAMLAGQSNIAGLGGPAIISNVLKGGDIIQLAAIVKTFTIPMYVQPKITELAQLRGQKLGVTRFGTVTHLTAQAILQNARISDVTIIQTGGIPESAAALSSGTIAAAMVSPPQSLLVREQGFRELVGVRQLRDMNIRFVEYGIAARRSWAEKNSDTVKRFMRASFEGLKRVFDDKALSLKVLSKYGKIDEQRMLEESYDFAIDAFSKDATVPAQAVEAMIEQMISVKLIEPDAKKTPVAAYYDNRYVNELEKEGFFKKLWQ